MNAVNLNGVNLIVGKFQVFHWGAYRTYSAIKLRLMVFKWLNCVLHLHMSEVRMERSGILNIIKLLNRQMTQGQCVDSGLCWRILTILLPTLTKTWGQKLTELWRAA